MHEQAGPSSIPYIIEDSEDLEHYESISRPGHQGLEEPLSHDFGCEEEESNTPHMDSTERLIRWIGSCQRSSGLSNRDVDNLFNDVLLHPSFKVEDLKVRSAATVNSYGDVMYKEADGWKKEDIHGHILHYRDPIQGLKSLF